jgi:hypothetical protein
MEKFVGTMGSAAAFNLSTEDLFATAEDPNRLRIQN